MDVADIVKIGYVAFTEIDKTLKFAKETDTDADTTLAVIVGINNMAKSIIDIAAENVVAQEGGGELQEPEEEQEIIEEIPEEPQEEAEDTDLSEQEKESIEELGEEIFGKRRRGRPKRK